MSAQNLSLSEQLQSRVSGRVCAPGTPQLRDEVATFNTATEHDPELVLAAASASDVLAGVTFAREHRLGVSVLGGGHGGYGPVRGGLLISTRRLNHLSVDPEKRTATFGAGARWGEIIAEAARHNLAPVAGSSPTVGAVGYLLGGGIGPLARSHGFSSDYVTRFTVVTGTGALVTASERENADLFWALRGGKSGVGVVTEAEIRLIGCPSLYAGSLLFAEEHIETAFRGWIGWQPRADARVTTSIAIIRFPSFEGVPAPLRGRRLLALRFAFPGPLEEGERLAVPLRALAPVYMDDLRPLALADVARIHSDPTNPSATWFSGALLREMDDAFASTLLEHCGPRSLFSVVEIRHVGGGATHQDVTAGSAASGRSAHGVLGVVGTDVSAFKDALPAAFARLRIPLTPWLSEESNVNFMGDVLSEEQLARAWPRPIHERLQTIRQRFDPDRLFARER